MHITQYGDLIYEQCLPPLVPSIWQQLTDTDPTLRSDIQDNMQLWSGIYRGDQETRLREHQAAIRRGEMERLAIAEHAWTKQHYPLWDGISILNWPKDNTTLLIQELSTTHSTSRTPFTYKQKSRDIYCRHLGNISEAHQTSYMYMNSIFPRIPLSATIVTTPGVHHH